MSSSPDNETLQHANPVTVVVSAGAFQTPKQQIGVDHPCRAFVDAIARAAVAVPTTTPQSEVKSAKRGRDLVDPSIDRTRVHP